jgi:hypothetical protein
MKAAEKEIHKRWESETKYYDVFFMQDLFGDWILDRYWGSRFTRIGGSKITYCNCYEDGLTKLKGIDLMRKKRGYKVRYENILNEPVQVRKKAKQKYLTKSKFKSAIECPVKLFYYDKKKEYANLMSDNDFLQALAEGGYQVGELAKLYVPDGVEIETLDYAEALAQTNELLKKESVTIYEAAVKYGNCFVRVDILVKKGSHMELIEVKAKSFNTDDDTFLNKSGYIDSKWRPYLYDVAFQQWVLEHSFPGYTIEPYLMMADKAQKTSVDGINQFFKIKKSENNRVKIIRSEGLNAEKLGEKILCRIPVKDCVELIWKGKDKDDKKKNSEELKSFQERIDEYSDYYIKNIKYPVSIGAKCKNCEYKTNDETEAAGLKSGFIDCWSKGCSGQFHPEKPHIFELWNFRKSEELINNGFYCLEDIPEHYFSKRTPTTERQYLQIIKTCREGEEKEQLDSKIFKEMDSWKFPLHFIDFETTMVAIPFNRNRRPYEQIAFQFSSHTLHEDGRVEHEEFLSGEPGAFPNFDFITALKDILQRDNGTVFRYAMHENTVLRQIQSQLVAESKERVLEKEYDYDDLTAWVDTVTQYKDGKEMICGERNMVDMLELVKKYYYHAAMKGSNSIKYVLPAVLKESSFLKDKYSTPLAFGTNLKTMVFWQPDEEGKPKNPYRLLPSVFEDIETDGLDLFMDSGEIREGGAALTAYARMQFEEMSDVERNAISNALLKYCELDTLAMIMIYEHWKSMEE